MIKPISTYEEYYDLMWCVYAQGGHDVYDFDNGECVRFNTYLSKRNLCSLKFSIPKRDLEKHPIDEFPYTNLTCQILSDCTNKFAEMVESCLGITVFRTKTETCEMCCNNYDETSFYIKTKEQLKAVMHLYSVLELLYKKDEE